MGKRNVLTLLVTIILFTSCETDYTTFPKSPEELKKELREWELLFPMKYLSIKDFQVRTQRKKTRNAGLFHSAEYVDDGALLQGYIINEALLVEYKDIVLKIGYFSKTETLIKEDTVVLYEFNKPHSRKHFSIKIEPPKFYESVSYKIINAKGVTK